MPRGREITPGFALFRYLGDPEDPRITQLAATQSVLPDHEGCQAQCGRVPLSVRTSLLPVRSEFTNDGSLAGLTAASSSGAPESVSSSQGRRWSDRHARLLVPDNSNALTPAHLPPLRDTQRYPLVLQCPFDFLRCTRQYPIENTDKWIEHSLSHFRVDGRRSRTALPPTSSQCCFCDKDFENADGLQCWIDRMRHVAWHHHAGYDMSQARLDFTLLRYLFENHIVDDIEYRDLMNSLNCGKSPFTSGKPVLAPMSSTLHAAPTYPRSIHRRESQSFRAKWTKRKTHTKKSADSLGLQQAQRSANTTLSRRSQSSDSLQTSGNMSVEDGNSQSGSCDESKTSPLPGELDLVTIQAKHELLVTLMKDVYGILGSLTEADIRTCAPSSHLGPSGTISHSSNSEKPDTSKNKKRQVRRHERPPGDDDDGKRRKKNGKDPESRDQSVRYACPFFKYNSAKYSTNNSTGMTYRTCTGPGFNAISRLK